MVRHRRRVEGAVKRLRDAGIVVSAFIEPIEGQIRTAARIGCQAVELWTGGYANARSPAGQERALKTLRNGLALGAECGLTVHGGHGLTYRNIGPVAVMEGFTEFNIGHSIIARAVFVGLRQAVREMKELLIRYARRQAEGR